MTNEKLEATDFLIEAVITGFNLTGQVERADFLEQEYEKQRAITEAETITKERQ